MSAAKLDALDFVIDLFREQSDRLEAELQRVETLIIRLEAVFDIINQLDLTNYEILEEDYY